MLRFNIWFKALPCGGNAGYPLALSGNYCIRAPPCGGNAAYPLALSDFLHYAQMG